MDTDDAELLNLSWKDYQASTIKTFQNLLGDEVFADVTLACGKGQQLKAHKVILSSCSPFFRNILVQNPHQHPILYLTGVDMEDLESLMKFIYTGEVQIENEGLAKFLETANDLEVDGLFQKKEKEKAMQLKMKEEEEKERERVLQRERALQEKALQEREEQERAIREAIKERELQMKELQAQREKERAAAQKKRQEEWELEKKSSNKKRKAEETKAEETIKEESNKVSPAKTTKTAAVEGSTKGGEKEKKASNPITWLKFLESQEAAKKAKAAAEATAILPKETPPPPPPVAEPSTAPKNEVVEASAEADTIYEVTAVDDSDFDMDALEVEFPEECAVGFDSGSTELKTTQETTKSRHECGFCPKTFARKGDVDRHMKKLHLHLMTDGVVALVGNEENGSEGSENFNVDLTNLNATPCDVCAKVFTTKWSMQEHRDSVHEGIRFLCDHCDHIASSKRNLRGHMGKKHPDSPLPSTYTSIRAEDTGFQKSFQNFHEIKAEDAEEAAAAMYEFEAFDQELEQKLESMAERKDGVWTCLECGKTAGTKFHLKRHAETHLEGFSHTCPRCYKSFGTRPALKQHFDSHHKEDKPTKAGYPCDLCDKTAISRGALRIHKYRHHTIA